ncbi:hypothetical protein [Chitinophaga flava]|uniref:Uncharacterized protein n=1 Tax=Chitinophaga flava TaxID=2259036 RepID=A0A365Y425_9BACT|nr:hypothetical protein [Chitinophaga flava]RBL93342.1 hypothetical protein DF182_12515 [Chitinophaga flava]
MNTINNTIAIAANTIEEKFSESDMIVTDYNTGNIEIQEAGDFTFLVDEPKANCVVLIPEEYLLHSLKTIVSNGAANEIYFDSEKEIAREYSFGKIIYHQVYIGKAAKAHRELSLFLQERF